jgi:folate-dependent phosphoribosylglycinamide formyltransferase PurN
VPVLPGDTEDTLHERIKRVERRLYPATIRRFVADTFPGADPSADPSADRPRDPEPDTREHT